MMYKIHDTDCTLSTVLGCWFVESWTQTVMSIALLHFMCMLLLWSSVVAYVWTRWMVRWPSSRLMVLFIIQISEPWCSEFKSPWSLMLMPLFLSLMTCSNNSGWDHVAGESHSTIPAIAQVTVSSVKLFLSLSEADWFHTVWNQILLQSCNVFYPSKNYLYFIRSKLVCFFTLCTSSTKVLGVK